MVAMAEKYAAAAFPVKRSATTARPMTIPAAPVTPCRNRTAISTVMDVVVRTDHRRDDEQSDAQQQRPAAPQPVGQRPGEQLAEGEADDAGGQRQLGRTCGRGQVDGEVGERGQIHVQTERPEAGQRPQRDDEPCPALLDLSLPHHISSASGPVNVGPDILAPALDEAAARSAATRRRPS